MGYDGSLVKIAYNHIFNYLAPPLFYFSAKLSLFRKNNKEIAKKCHGNANNVRTKRYLYANTHRYAQVPTKRFRGLTCAYLCVSYISGNAS